MFWRPWETNELMRRFDSTSLSFFDPISLVKRAIPESAPIKVTKIILNKNQGGAFVKFTYPENMSATDIESMTGDSLRHRRSLNDADAPS